MHDALILKGYAQNTRRTYLIEFAQLLYIIKDLPADDLTWQQLQSYILYCHKELKLSAHAIQQLIRQAKGARDRYVNLPESMLMELREYCKEYRPRVYLFRRAVQRIL